MAVVLAAALVAAMTSGCSAWVERQAMKSTTRMLVRTSAAMKQEPSVALARAAAASGIKTLEGFYVAFPDDPTLRAVLAEAVCHYGAGFLQHDWETAYLAGDEAAAEAARHEARLILSRCVGYGLLLLPPAWEAALWNRDQPPASPESFARLVAGASKRDVPGMFWVAQGLAAVIGMYPDDFELLGRLPQAELLLERVVALDEGFQDGMAHTMLGILRSAQPAAVGGDPERGKQHFERARELTGGRSLLIDVMYARFYGVSTRDSQLFARVLQAALQTPLASWPDYRLGNELAARKARLYLRHRGRWF